MYQTFIFIPLYNGLIGLMDTFPWMDAGVAVILFTVIVRLILFPLSKKAIITQVRMKEIQPEVDKLRETMKNDKEGQALKMMQLYKDKKVSPFSSFLVLFIQLPIIYALYSTFIKGLPKVNTAILYSFVHAPLVNMNFLGLVDISKKSIILALIAAAAQFLQLHFSLAAASVGTPGANPQADIAQNMTKNMKYVFPVIVFLISYKISAVIALYWSVSSLFTLAQELVVRRHLKNHQPL